MNFLGRAVFDTSTLVSAALRVDSVPAQALLKALGSMHLCASEATLLELTSVLSRPKFDRYVALAERALFVELIRSHSIVYEVPASVLATIGECRDAADIPFLALALACEASVLVSSDADLLTLHPYRGIPVLGPAAFVASATT